MWSGCTQDRCFILMLFYRVGAIDEHNNLPYYGEPCSAIFAVTYSSGAGSDRSIVSGVIWLAGFDDCLNPRQLVTSLVIITTMAAALTHSLVPLQLLH